MVSADTERDPAVVVIVGATGTGKSGLALDVAERLAAAGRAAEIVNADAMQLYRGMDIGTAKLPPQERRGIPHHLLDVLDIDEEASVAWYQARARAVIDDIQRRSAVPILVGGSGLYVSSVVFDFAFPARDEATRSRLEAELIERGPTAMHDRLREVAPATASRVDPANGRRIVRALEVHDLAEQGHGGTLPERPTPWRPARMIGLSVPRPVLTARLDARVEGMWRDGLVDEVAALVAARKAFGVTAGRAIGYRQALAHLRGEQSRSDAIAETQQLTRRYARRQVSWFKRYTDLVWLDPDTSDPVATVLTPSAPAPRP